MKDFFKKIWDSIKAFAKKVWDGIKAFPKKVWNWIKTGAVKAWTWAKELVNKVWTWITGLLKSVPYKKLYLFIAGLILAAIAYINLNIVGCIALPGFLFFIICFLRLFFTGKTDWWDLGAATLGGAIVQIMVFFV